MTTSTLILPVSGDQDLASWAAVRCQLFVTRDPAGLRHPAAAVVLLV